MNIKITYNDNKTKTFKYDLEKDGAATVRYKIAMDFKDIKDYKKITLSSNTETVELEPVEETGEAFANHILWFRPKLGI